MPDSNRCPRQPAPTRPTRRPARVATASGRPSAADSAGRFRNSAHRQSTNRRRRLPLVRHVRQSGKPQGQAPPPRPPCPLRPPPNRAALPADGAPPPAEPKPAEAGGATRGRRQRPNSSWQAPHPTRTCADVAGSLRAGRCGVLRGGGRRRPCRRGGGRRAEQSLSRRRPLRRPRRPAAATGKRPPSRLAAGRRGRFLHRRGAPRPAGQEAQAAEAGHGVQAGRHRPGRPRAVRAAGGASVSVHERSRRDGPAAS